MQDIRKWFMKPHEKGNGNASAKVPEPELKPETPAREGVDGSGRKKTSKYFAKDKQKGEEELPGKRKLRCEVEQVVKPPPTKKAHKVEVEDNDSDDDFVTPAAVVATPSKRLKSGSGRGAVKKPVKDEESDEDDEKGGDTPSKSGGRGRGGRGAGRGRGAAKKPLKDDESDEDAEKADDTPSKSGGRGRGDRGGSAAVPTGGRGRGGGGGRGGFTNFGERKDPPHKGEKEVPEGAPDCLAGLTFVISGTLDSLEREEAEDLIKRHGGRVTSAVSKKTSYLLCDEDVEGRKSSKAKELGTPFLTEDGLFDKIQSSKPSKTPAQEESKSPAKKQLKTSPQKSENKNYTAKDPAPKDSTASIVPAKPRKQSSDRSSLTWTEKYKPKVPNDIIGNQSLVTQLHNWLKNWDEQFSDSGKKGKGKKQNDSGAKKAVLLSGTPGIGKTTSAKLVSQMLGFQTIEVNASDSRGKADSKIFKGLGGSNANGIKEMINNEGMSFDLDRSKHPKTVLIMDEVDGMSAGDRGGVADLIDSIKKSKVPIICICNDRFSQKLKSLVNYCLLLNFRKPTKQQMAKRLMQVANAEGLQVNEIALEELAEKVNGDMRMALNQLYYMSLSMSVIKFDDVRQRLLSSAKDEDISPFTAVDKLFGFNGGRLRIDERLDISMSDPDLVPLLVQENYINYRPSSIGKDEKGIKRMSLLARAAESIADGDIINVQIRRYRQWQLFQNGSIASCITPAALLHGQREILVPGERNFNRFGGWLGKNSTTGKNVRLLEDLHYHLLASRESNLGRGALRLEYLNLLLKRLTDPLRVLPKDEGVREVVEFMNLYSISQEDVDTIVELSKFQGHANPLDCIPSAVKAALTRAYKEGSKSKMVRAADMITLPGMKKAPKKRVAAMLEPPVDGIEDESGELPPENEEGNSSDVEDLDGASDESKLQLELQSLNSKGIRVEMELNNAKSSAKKTPAAGRGKGGSTPAEKKPAGRGKGGAGSSEKAGAKRKR